VSEPAPPPLIVSADDIARRLGVDLPLSDDDRWLIEQAIGDAQTDLEAYLGRAVTPRTYTDEHVRRTAAVWPDEWRLSNWPIVSITSVTEETDEDGDPTGLYTVVYVAGLDGANDPELAPLRRYVMAAAIHSELLRAWYARKLPDLARRVTSLGVDGQTVTFTDTYSGGGSGQEGAAAIGGPPAQSSVDRWRIAGRRVVQHRGLHDRWRGRDWAYEWPYNGGF
jgi:hypothetical protein